MDSKSGYLCCQGQLNALIKKSLLEKIRDSKQFFFECFSHILILSLLIYGFRLSHIVYFGERSYASTTLHFPRDVSGFGDLKLESANTNNFASFPTSSTENDNVVVSYLNDLFEIPIPVLGVTEYVELQNIVARVLKQKNIESEFLISSIGRKYENLLLKGTLHITPRNELVSQLASYLHNTTPSLSIQLHDSEDSALSYILDHPKLHTFALVIINSITSSNIDYIIRQNYSTIPNTNLIYNVFSLGLDNEYQKYYTSGFLSLQKSINTWAFSFTMTNTNTTQSRSQLKADSCASPPSVFAMPMPTAAYDQNPFYPAVGFLLGLALTMATLYPMSRLVKSVVEEKESKMREVMKIMGLRDWVHQLSWFLTAFIVFTWIIATTTLLCSHTFLPASNTWLLFGYFFLFAMSEITLSFLVAVFFSNSKLAAIVGPVVLFVFIIPRFIFLTTNSYEETTAKLGSSILSPTAFSLGADIIASYEQVGVGVQFSNMNEGDYSFSTVIAFLFVDTLLYAALAWYFGQILPSEYGTPQKPWFIFMYKYWFPSSGPKSVTSTVTKAVTSTAYDGYQMLSTEEIRNELAEFSLAHANENVEMLTEEQKARVQVVIHRLQKRYDDGKLAVKSLDLAMVEGEITCLLGHNGAGKSTTISVLTGLHTATSGHCSVFGRSLVTELPAIRSMTGICPQQNVLFRNLTVLEHLLFFGELKGLKGKDLQDAAVDIIANVGLKEKLHVASASLSGGMKRKLCLANALIGDPKFVLLDEPTSGMDPYSRRCIWELLRQKKRGRVTLLTTHFMDEADILGDRIAIMSEGRLRCSGSSLFLKNRFGVGYILTMAKAEQNCSVPDVTNMVLSHVPDAKLQAAVAGEMVYQMPVTAVRSFASLFTRIKDQGPLLGVGAYGISITTLEQVFISLAKEPGKKIASEEDFPAPFITRLGLGTRRCYENILKSLNEWNISLRAMLKNTFINDSQKHNPTVHDDNCPPDAASKEADSTFHLPFHDVAGDISEAEINPLQRSIVRESVSEDVTYDYVMLPKTVPSDETDDVDVITEPSTTIQFLELLRKRFIITSRDLKGLFFQIVFPAIQIALVLFLLTIHPNPAGRPLSLEPTVFSHSEVLYSGNVSNVPGADNIATSAVPLPVQNSRTLSEQYLLPTVSNHQKSRFAAYVFNDEISYNISIDWDATIELLNSTFNNFHNINNQINIRDLVQYCRGKSLRDALDEFLNVSSTTAMAEIIEHEFGINVSAPFIRKGLSKLDDILGNISIDSLLRHHSVFHESIIISDSVRIDIQLGPLNYSASNLIDFLNLHGTKSILIFVTSPYTLIHNTTSPHAVAVFTEALAASAFKECSSDKNASFTIHNHPLPLTATQTIEIKVILSILTTLLMLIPLCYIPASFVTFVVKERVTKSKHLQMVSGVPSYLYWISTYIWDMLLYSLLTAFILCVFYIYGINASQVFISSLQNTIAVILLIFLYGASCLPLNYLYSFLFQNHATAQIAIMLINFLTGYVFLLAYVIMISIPETERVAKSIVHFFRLFPPFNVGEGLLTLSGAYFKIYVTGQKVNYLDYDIAGRNIIFLCCETWVFLSILLLSESQFMKLIAYKIQQMSLKADESQADVEKSITNEDDDVILERERLRAVHPADYALLVRDLTKTYPPPSIFGGTPSCAVRGVSLGCPVGETFGLLGINGAGKTTTLSILTGDFPQTSGECFIGGSPVSDSKTKQLVGYCPQVDPLLDLMTGYETLWFFGRIRGIQPTVLRWKVENLVRELGLLAYAGRPCGRYSGGNKRKLSLGIALIGDPRVLFLDEPSTGMDPEARRHMWSIIAAVAQERSVILTTHSMEECEALCSRVGIMSAGRMQCLGSIQHIKSRFGASYEIEIRCSSGYEEAVRIFCLEDLKETSLEYMHGSFFRLKAHQNLDLAHTFGLLEENKASLGILEYSVSQATLEQIFVRLAREQEQLSKKSSDSMTV